MKVVAIISARMTSSRLPGKSLMKICGDPVLQHMLTRVKRAKLIDKIIVATTVNKTDDCINDLCKKMGVSCFRGPEQDVLKRYYLAAKKYNVDPDMAVFGKALGNGYSITSVIGKASF